MDNFNAHKWFKNQYLKESDDPKIGAELEAGMFGTGVAEGEGGGSKSQQLAIAMNNAMVEIDDSMSYKDFAEAVADILTNEYGSHNFGPFMEVLHARLGMNESLNESIDKETLKRELEDKFNVSPIISNFNGKIDQIQFDTRSEFQDNEWNKILDYIKSKGFEITKESNYADEEPGERSWYPRIDVK